MSKNQESWRKALDFIYAQDDFLNYDGSTVAHTRLGKAFSSAAKPEYIATLLGSAAEIALSPASELPAGFITGSNLLSVVMASTLFKWMLVQKRDFYFDTQKKTAGSDEPKILSELKKHKLWGGIGMLMDATFWVSDILRNQEEIGLGQDSMVDGHRVGTMVLYLGYCWRAQQVLDGNWSVTTKKPGQKKYSLKDAAEKLGFSGGKALPQPSSRVMASTVEQQAVTLEADI